MLSLSELGLVLLILCYACELLYVAVEATVNYLTCNIIENNFKLLQRSLPRITRAI